MPNRKPWRPFTHPRMHPIPHWQDLARARVGSTHSPPCGIPLDAPPPETLLRRNPFHYSIPPQPPKVNRIGVPNGSPSDWRYLRELWSTRSGPVICPEQAWTSPLHTKAGPASGTDRMVSKSSVAPGGHIPRSHVNCPTGEATPITARPQDSLHSLRRICAPAPFDRTHREPPRPTMPGCRDATRRSGRRSSCPANRRDRSGTGWCPSCQWSSPSPR